MGADYYAHAIIGIELPDIDSLPRLKKKVRKKAFRHSFEDDGEMEFDPKTGKPLWTNELEEVETDEPVVVYDPDEVDLSDLEKGQKILKAPKGMSFHFGTDSESVLLGVVASTGSSNGGDDVAFLPIPDVSAIREKLRRLLQPLDLWDESKFGLYANLYCSY